MPLRSGDFQFKIVFGCNFRQKFSMRSGILCTSLEIMHTPRSNSPLLFDIKNMQQIHTAKYMLPLSICSRSSRHASALAAGSLRQDHAWISAEQLFCFHKYEFDDVLCKLNATEYTRSFESNPTLPPLR